MIKYRITRKYFAIILFVSITTIYLVCYCNKRHPLNTTYLVNTDSICYSILYFDTLKVNTLQFNHKDTFWIKDKNTINSIIKAFDNNTDYVFAKHGTIVRNIDFYVGDTIINVCVCQGGTVLDGGRLYLSDINFVIYMDNITYKSLQHRKPSQ